MWADAAGPTDYRSSIVAIEPATPTIHPSIIGGDSFLQLTVVAGTTVEVLGYQSEPFIRFLADGTVEENRTSASYFVSRSRNGTQLPADFDDNAKPDWRTVATSSEYTWHDHRIHWMTDLRPPGKRPGDVILRQSVPLVVDGVATALVVESVWLPGPSILPVWFGAGSGLLLGLLTALRRRLAPAVGLVAFCALTMAVGIWQYRSLPASTGPRLEWWALPTVAFVAAVGVALARRRPAGLAEHAGLMLAGTNLALWGWQRRTGFTKALLATDAPGWLDRATGAAAITAGAFAALAGLLALTIAAASPHPHAATSAAS